MKIANDARRDTTIELNLTSMIDVIFLLLIFFVLTSNFQKPEKLLPTNLGGSGAIVNQTVSQQERDLGKIVVRIARGATGRVGYSVDGGSVGTLDEVEATLSALQEIDPNVPVVIDPEPEVPIENVLDVYDRARRAGLAQIKFTASPTSLARFAR